MCFINLINVCRIDDLGIIKVADFGLCQGTYQKQYFRQDKNECVKLPIKWMAIESIEDGLYTEKTDVVRSMSKCSVSVQKQYFIYNLVVVEFWSDMLGGIQWWEGTVWRTVSSLYAKITEGR